jgi:hypothetical protein
MSPQVVYSQVVATKTIALKPNPEQQMPGKTKSNAKALKMDQL